MQCRDGPLGEVTDQRIVQVIDMEMQHVELVGPPPNIVEHDDMVREWVPDRRIEPQRHVRAPHQLRSGTRISAGKQRHIVSFADEFLGQIGYDPLRAAVKTRRTAFG